MNHKQIDQFEKIQSLVNSIYEEIKTLSNKHPDDAINEFKLALVNQAISKANGFLTGSYKPFDDFDLFDNDKLPSNSDVVFILSYYLSAFEKLRSDNIVLDYESWYWVIDGNRSTIVTGAPRKLLK